MLTKKIKRRLFSVFIPKRGVPVTDSVADLSLFLVVILIFLLIHLSDGPLKKP